MSTDPLEQVSFGKPVRQHIAEFAQLFALISVAVALYLGLTGSTTAVMSYWTAGGLAFLAAGRFVPRLLLPLWKGWIKLAYVLEITTSYLIIFIMWFGMMVPMGLLLKLIGKRVMDLSFRAPVGTYWETREDKYHDFKLLERQF